MLSPERLTADEYEKQYYGLSSTEIYIDLSETVERYLKHVFLEYTKAIEDAGKEVPKELLLEEYEKCLAVAKVKIQKFHEEVQKVFEIPKNVILPENINNFSDTDLQNLEQECLELEQEFLKKKIYLAKLKQQKDIIEKVVLPKRAELNMLLKEINSQRQYKFKKVMTEVEENLKKLDADFLTIKRNFY